jgi:hypothetical protein
MQVQEMKGMGMISICACRLILADEQMLQRVTSVQQLEDMETELQQALERVHERKVRYTSSSTTSYSLAYSFLLMLLCSNCQARVRLTWESHVLSWSCLKEQALLCLMGFLGVEQNYVMNSALCGQSASAIQRQVTHNFPFDIGSKKDF